MIGRASFPYKLALAKRLPCEFCTMLPKSFAKEEILDLEVTKWGSWKQK
jgi:hypothetical protein